MADIPRGEPKSGRFWKTPKQRFKSIVKTPGLKKANTYEKFMKLKEEKKKSREITLRRLAERQEKVEKKKERRRNNIQRQKEHALKTDVVQVIKDPRKIKKMKKKQLRTIEKRDTLNASQTKN